MKAREANLIVYCVSWSHSRTAAHRKRESERRRI